MDTSAAAPAGTAVCIEIIGGSEIKTEPLDAIPEHSTDDGVLIEPPQQHVFLRPFPPIITSQPVVVTEKKANRVRHTAAAAAATAATTATATTTASSASGTSSTSVANTEVADFSIFVAASATPNPSTSAQVLEAEIVASFHREKVSIASGSPSIDQMEQRAGSAAFFRRKKAIPIAVAKKMGSSKATKTVPSKVTPPTAVKNAIPQIERDADESRPSPDQTTEVKQTVPESVATTAASMTTEQTLQPAKDEQRMQLPNAKPVAFRRVKPKVSLLPTSKPSKSTLQTSTESKNEPSPSDSLVASIESDLNEPKHGKKEGKEMVVTSPGDESKQAEMDLSTEPVTTIQQDQTIIDQKKIANENSTSLTDTQPISASLDQPVNEIELDAAAEQLPQRSAFPDPHNDKENLLVATTVPPETPKSTSMEETSSQPVAVSPVAPGKTIKRTIKLGSLPLDLAKQLKSAIGIGKRTNAKLAPGMSGEKKSQQPGQRSDDVKVASIEAADTKLGEVDLRHRPSEEPTEPAIVPLLSSVEESCSSTQTSVTTCPLVRPPNDDCVVSGPLENSHTETVQIDVDDASMKPLPSTGENSMQLVKANDTEHVPSVTPAEAVETAPQPTASSKKIKKISYLTPLQQKMLLSSLIKGKPKLSDQPAPTIDGANAEMARSSTEKQPPETVRPIVTSAPKPPTVGFPSSERKIKIISHVILPNLKLPSQCHAGAAGGASKFSTGADQGAPMVAIHPPSFSTSAFTSTQQYPKLFVIHSTAPVASDVHSAPSTSSATPPQIASSETGEAHDAGDVPQSSPHATVEKRPEPQGLVLTVLPRPQLGVDVPAPSQAASSATVPGDHRIVPKIVIDKSYVENDSQSSSSCSSFSSPEQAANVSSAAKAKRKAKLNRAQHGTEGPMPDTANTGPETQPKVMGCSRNTRDKLRERILKNMDRKGPVVLFPTIRRVYSRKPQSAPAVPSESVEGMGLKSLSGSVETETVQRGTHLSSSAQPQPVDLRMQPVMVYPLEDQPKVVVQCRTGDGVESEEPLHTEQPSDSRHLQQAGQESLDFYGFSNSTIDREQLECDKKIRAIEAKLQTERIQQEREKLEHNESDRSSPVVMDCGIVSDAIDSTDEREDCTESPEEDRQTERTSSSNLEPCLPPENAMQSSSSSCEDHRKVEAPCEIACTASVALPGRPSGPVEGIVSPVEHGYVKTPTSFSDTGDNSHAEEAAASEMKDVIELTSADSNVVEEIAECSDVEQDNFAGQLDKCSAADARRPVADDHQEEDNFIGTTTQETQACTSTIAPLRTSVHTRSPSVPEAHETTGVDLIVAMAMSMKEADVDDDEHSDVDSDDGDFGAEPNRFDEMEQDEAMEDGSCTGTVREQPMVSLSRINKKKRRKKRKDKIVELLLRHVNYGSLMGELAAKVDRKRDTTERTASSSEESDDDESESIIHLMDRIKGRDRDKHAPPVEIFAQNLCTDEDEKDKKFEQDGEESERLDRVHIPEPQEADKPFVDSVNACLENKCQEVKQPVCLQGEDEGDGFGSKSMELPSVESAEKSNDLLERQEHEQHIEQTQEEPRDEANDHCEESCHSFASDGDDQRRDDDGLAAENSAICDITDDEEIIGAQYSTEAKKSNIRSSLDDDPSSCTRRLSVAAVETAAESSAPVAPTICDISDNDIEESTTASSTVLDSAQGGCVTTKTGATEEANETESSPKSVTEPVVAVEVMEARANLVEDTSVASVSGSKKGAKKGRKRSNKSSPPVDRPAKRKNPLNLLDIKPPSPPVFDSSEAPVANEVVSDCSTDGFSAVDPTSRQELVGTVQKKPEETPGSMAAERDAKGGSKAPKLDQKCYVSIPLIVWKAKNDAALKERKDECSSKVAPKKVNSRSTNAERAVGVVGKSPVGRGGGGGDGNAQSSGEDDGKSNRSQLGKKTQRAGKQMVSRGNAAHSRPSRKSRRSHSSSSSRRSSSSGGSNVQAADVSSDDSFRPRVTRAAKRHKLKRKKRSTPRGNVAAAPNTTTTTKSTASATSRSTNSSTRRSARCKLSKASTISKASNTDERYVISEVDTADEAPQRVLEVVNARYQQVLAMAGTNTRSAVINTVPLDRLTAPTAQTSASDGSREGTLSLGIGTGQSEPESQSVAAEELSSGGIDVSKQPKRGRPPKTLGGGGESDESVDDSVTEYKCGNCGKEMHRSCWKEHHASHNGVAFRVGIDEPLDLSDIKAVGYAIMRFMRANRRFEVICEKCGQVKKSFMGMASHLKTCGISKEEKDSAKVACEHCGRKMLIVSIPSHHALYCRVLKEQREKEAAAERGEPMAPDGAGEEESLTASGRQKRRAVACAEQKIRKIARETIEEPKELIIKVTGQTVTMGILQCWLQELKETGQATCRHKSCFFVGTSEKKMRIHNDICPYAPTAVPVYECAICLCQDPSREVVYEHLRREHPKELIRTQEQSAPSGDEDDANVASSDMADGSSGSDDLDLDGDVLDEDDAGADGRKGGRKKKQAAPARSKPKKGPQKTPKKSPASKKGVAPADDDLQMGVMGEEGEVYKEMVYEEAAEYRHQRANIRFAIIQWMFKFLREQYGTRQLFEQLRPDVDVRFLTMLAIRDYLPRSGQSMRFRLRKIKLYDVPFDPDETPDGWQRMGTFQGQTLDTESMFYCGGPVMALDWLPIPSDCEDGAVDQILAVACKSRYEEFYTCQQLSKRQRRKCLIQIWNVGPLRNASSTTEEPPTKKSSSARCKKARSEYADEVRCPQLSFAIACDFGPIWQLAFCPSGCNNETGRGDSFDRLGLLAATGSDGDVYVFALNRAMVGVRSERPGTWPTAPRIVHLQPVLHLSLTLHRRPAFATEPNAIPCFTGHSVMRISWTREKGHSVLAAGYSNGIVAVWKLTTASFSSPLLSASKGGIRTLLPTHKLLHGSGSSITSLDIHYGQSSRLLAVTNADRRLKVYDLHSGHHQPLEVLSVLARSRITAMRWLLHFPVLVFVFDDTFLIDRCGYTVLQPRDIGIRTLPLIILGTEATDLAANDWISTNAVTTDGGDLVCHKPIPFVTGIPGKQFGQVLTTTTSVKLNGANAAPTIVSTYDAFHDSFGLLLSDTDENPAECDRKSLRVKTFRRGNIEQYPAVRLNQIRWNPNSSSFLYYAVGYQAGFVRIRKMPL